MRVHLLNLAETLAGRPLLGESKEIALPMLDGCPLGFTDGCALPDGAQLASLSAERSPDVYSDGTVAGSVLFDLQRELLIPLLDIDGKPFAGKLEGICPQPGTTNLIG